MARRKGEIVRARDEELYITRRTSSAVYWWRQRGPDEAGVSQMGEKEHPCIQNLGAQSLQNRQKHQFNVHKALSFSFRCVQDTRSL